MKTEDFVDFLSTNPEPVNRKTVGRTIRLGLAGGALAALLIALVGLGLRSDLATARGAIFMTLKLAFAIAVVGLALNYLTRLARPGGEQKPLSLVVFLPFVLIVLLALLSLGLAPRSHWQTMILGNEWLECLVSIPVIAIVPFAVCIWAVRKAAPTDLVRTGAVAGLIAGGISAFAYSVHCSDDSLPFVAVWYGGTIVLCALAGAMLGPRLLRW